MTVLIDIPAGHLVRGVVSGRLFYRGSRYLIVWDGPRAGLACGLERVWWVAFVDLGLLVVDGSPGCGEGVTRCDSGIVRSG